jgi:1,4-dihydroxy-2-naphthoate octaprenyltransferase
MGAGISRYLGFPLRDRLVILGLVVVLLFQLAMDWLEAAFRPLTEPLGQGESVEDRGRVRKAVLLGAIAALAATAALVFVLIRFEGASSATILCLGLLLIVILLYAIPPMRANDQGFGELLLAVQIAYLVPSLGFLLQAGDNHLLLNVCTAALTLLLIATLLVLELPAYAEDIRRGHVTLLTRMGWQRALTVHHGLIAASYMLLGISILLAFSFSVIGPALLTLPFALLQVLLLRGIADGSRPIWNLLRANALAIFALTTYFLTLSFWLR